MVLGRAPRRYRNLQNWVLAPESIIQIKPEREDKRGMSITKLLLVIDC